MSVTYPSMVWHFIIVTNKNLRGRERTRFKSMKHLVSLMNLNIVNVILSYIYIIQFKKEYDCICVVKLLHQIRFFFNPFRFFLHTRIIILSYGFLHLTTTLFLRVFVFNRTMAKNAINIRN